MDAVLGIVMVDLIYFGFTVTTAFYWFVISAFLYWLENGLELAGKIIFVCISCLLLVYPLLLAPDFLNLSAELAELMSFLSMLFTVSIFPLFGLLFNYLSPLDFCFVIFSEPYGFIFSYFYYILGCYNFFNKSGFSTAGSIRLDSIDAGSIFNVSIFWLICLLLSSLEC